MMPLCAWLTVAVVVLFPAWSRAAVIATVAPVTQTVLGPNPGTLISTLLPGFVSQDVVFDTDGTDWLSAQLRIIPDTNAQIYQHASGGVSSPNPADFTNIDETLEFDTYVSNGTFNDPLDTTLGAVDLGGGATSTFDADVLDITWFTTDDDEIGQLALARVTLKRTAQGMWKLRFTALPAGGPIVQYDALQIVDGVLIIPEPGAAAMLGMLATSSLLRRRRR